MKPYCRAIPSMKVLCKLGKQELNQELVPYASSTTHKVEKKKPLKIQKLTEQKLTEITDFCKLTAKTVRT